MKKALLLMLMIVLTAGLFADDSDLPTWAKSYNEDMQLNIYASIGYWVGLNVSAGAELIFGEINIPSMPLDWGVEVRAIFQSLSYFTYTATYLGAAPMLTLHLGLADIPLEFYIGAGIGIYGHFYSGGTDAFWEAAGYDSFGLGFASIDGVIWHFSEDFGLILEYGYVGNASIWGIGVQLAL